MSNLLEEGRVRVAEQEEEIDPFREIFTTAIKLLEIKGRLSARLPHNRYQVFQHKLNSPRQEATNVVIVAGEDLVKARKISMHVNGVGTLEVRKRVFRGQETYKGKELNGISGRTEDLNGSSEFHHGVIGEYLKKIRMVSSEAVPQSH